jgi:hypothetical protein
MAVTAFGVPPPNIVLLALQPELDRACSACLIRLRLSRIWIGTVCVVEESNVAGVVGLVLATQPDGVGEINRRGPVALLLFGVTTEPMQPLTPPEV